MQTGAIETAFFRATVMPGDGGGACFGRIRAGRLTAVLADIAANFDDPEVGAHRVGQRLGLTGRYVQHLLEGAGLSFATHVRDLRLDAAHRMLEAGPDARIIDVAYTVGFRDLSYFNREFRRRFGQIPTSVRSSRRIAA